MVEFWDVINVQMKETTCQLFYSTGSPWQQIPLTCGHCSP